MTTYLATQNVPGYLPMADEPDEFETAEMAWDFLLAERNTDLDNFEAMDEPDEAIAAMEAAKAAGAIGSVAGTTPGYDGDHDLGIHYTVMEVDEA